MIVDREWPNHIPEADAGFDAGQRGTSPNNQLDIAAI